MKKRLMVSGKSHNASTSVIPLGDDILKIDKHITKSIKLLFGALSEYKKYQSSNNLIYQKEIERNIIKHIENTIIFLAEEFAENITYKIKKRYNLD